MTPPPVQATWARRGAAAVVRQATPGLLTLLAALLLTAPLQAQAGSASIAGVVTSARGDSAIARATVLVDGTLLRGLTDSRGRYRIRGLAPGRYTVNVVVLGYGPASRDDVVVAAGDTVRLDFALNREAVALSGLVVTVSRQEEQQGESAASVDVIPQVELEQRDVTSLSQALPFASGVTYAAGQLDIRGASGLSGGVGSRVLLLLDGHPILTGDTGELDFDALPVLGVQRVEIVKGPYSALYGSNALGGVVNIITSPLPEHPRTTMRLYGGMYDLPPRYRFSDRAPLSGGIELEQSLRLGSLGTRLFGARSSDDGYTQNGQVSRWLFRTELAFPVTSSDPSSLYAIWCQENIGEFFGWRADSLRFEVPPAALGDWYRMSWVNLGATLNVISTASTELSLGPYLYHDAVQNHFHDNQDWHQGTRAGSTIQLSLRPGASQGLTLGGEAARTTVRSDIIGQPVIDDFGLFAQDELPLGDRFKLSLGARIDDHRVHDGLTEAQLSPKFGLVYRAGHGINLRLSASHAFRAPSPVEQFVSTTQYGVHVIPNPDLHAETVTAGEIGVTAPAGSRVWIDGSIFQSEYRDLIQPAPAPGQLFVFQFQNVDRARIRGLDLESRVAVLPDLMSLDVTYMYLDARDLLTGEFLPYRSMHTGTATLELLQGLLDVDLQYRSRVLKVLQYPLDKRGSATIVGLRAAYRLHGLIVQLKASNLLQARYVDLQERFPGAPRNFRVTLSHGL